MLMVQSYAIFSICNITSPTNLLHNAHALRIGSSLFVGGAQHSLYGWYSCISLSFHNSSYTAVPKSAFGSNGHQIHPCCRLRGWLRTASSPPGRCRAAATLGCRWIAGGGAPCRLETQDFASQQGRGCRQPSEWPIPICGGGVSSG